MSTATAGRVLELMQRGATLQRPNAPAGSNARSYPRSAFLEIGQREERVMPRTLVALEDAGYLQSEDTGNQTRWTLTSKGRDW